MGNTKETRDGRKYRHVSPRLSTSRSSDKGSSQDSGGGSPTSVMEKTGEGRFVWEDNDNDEAKKKVDPTETDICYKTKNAYNDDGNVSLFKCDTGTVSAASSAIDESLTTSNDDDRYDVGAPSSTDSKIPFVRIEAVTATFESGLEDRICKSEDEVAGHDVTIVENSMDEVVVGCPGILCANPVVDLMNDLLAYTTKHLNSESRKKIRKSANTSNSGDKKTSDQNSVCDGSVHTTPTVAEDDFVLSLRSSGSSDSLTSLLRKNEPPPSVLVDTAVKEKTSSTNKDSKGNLALVDVNKHLSSDDNKNEAHPAVNVNASDVNDSSCFENSMVWSISDMCITHRTTNMALLEDNNNQCSIHTTGLNNSVHSDSSFSDEELVLKDGSKFYICGNTNSRIRSRNRVSIFNASSKHLQDLRFGTTFDYPVHNMDVIQTTKSFGDDFREEEFAGDFNKNGAQDLHLDFFMNSLGIESMPCTSMVGGCIPFTSRTNSRRSVSSGSLPTISRKKSLRQRTSSMSSMTQNSLAVPNHNFVSGKNNIDSSGNNCDSCTSGCDITGGGNDDFDDDDKEAEDVFYDSDSRDVRFRHKRPRRAIVEKSEIAICRGGQITRSNSNNNVRRKHGCRFSQYKNRTDIDLNDNRQLDIFVQEMKHMKMDIIWHPSQSAENTNGPLRLMRSRAWIEMGSLLSQHIIHPKFMWKPAYEPNLFRKKINVVTPHSIDLLDIIGIVPVQQQEHNRGPRNDEFGVSRQFGCVDRREHPFAHPWASFKITTVKDCYFLFEAEDRVMRDKIVLGLKLIVARLASKVLVAGEVAEDEFFTPGGGRQVYDAWWAEEDDDEEDDDYEEDDQQMSEAGDDDGLEILSEDDSQL